MFDQVGGLLRQQGKRWAVRCDNRSGAWHILDLWHESLAGLTPESEVPIDSPALRVLPADTFQALIEEADRLGLLPRLVESGHKKSKSAEEVSEKVSEKVPEKGSEGFYRFKVRMEALGIVRQIVAVDSAAGLVE